MKPAFTHCALHVHDLDPSVDFYRSYCGLQRSSKSMEKARDAWLGSQARARKTTSSWCCSAVDRREQDKDDMTHYGFGVASRDDIDKIAERGRRAGLAALGAATMSC